MPCTTWTVQESIMTVHVENLGQVAVLECEGRLVRSDAAYMLRDAVLAQKSAKVVVLDFSHLRAVEGGGLGMLVYLQDWTHRHDIQLKIFNPHSWVKDRLEQAPSKSQFEIATADELVPLAGGSAA
jgi:anti-anti-sigma regulatory factor